jgi:hypothetical protein
MDVKLNVSRRYIVFFIGVITLFVSNISVADINSASIKAATGKHSVLTFAAPALPPKPTAEKPHLIPHVSVDGDLRSYFFDREFSNPALDQQDSISFGAKINLLTDVFLKGFRVGATVFTAQPFGLNSHNYMRVDRTLPGSPITVLGQAFLEYQNKFVLGKIGNQTIDTPWMNQADSRMIPAAFQGIYTTLNPIHDLTFTGMRIIRFKPRIASRFTQTNLYNTSNLSSPIVALGNKTDIGALAIGAQLQHEGLSAQLWEYKFYNFSNLAYGDIGYRWENKSWIKPVIGAQAGTQWEDGNNVLQSVGAGSSYGSVFGALIGAEILEGKISLGYDYLPQRSGAFRDGDIISPYTSGYESDPLYTTSMIAGIIEKAAGSSIKFKMQYDFFHKQIQVSGSYAKYHTQPSIPNTDETDFDAMYLPDGLFKNLSIRYRVGFLNGNPAFGHFVYNRIMLQYSFA